MRRYIALLIVLVALVGGMLVEHFMVTDHFESLIVDAQALQEQLINLEDNVTPPPQILQQAQNIEKRFSDNLPVIEAMTSHNCLKDLKLKLAEVIAAIKVKSIKDASMQLQTVIALLEHFAHLGKFQPQHLL